MFGFGRRGAAEDKLERAYAEVDFWKKELEETVHEKNSWKSKYNHGFSENAFLRQELARTRAEYMELRIYVERTESQVQQSPTSMLSPANSLTPRSVSTPEPVDSKALAQAKSRLKEANIRVAILEERLSQQSQENTLLKKQNDLLRTSEAAFQREARLLREELKNQRGINDLTADETTKLLLELSRLQQSQAQLQSELLHKEEMIKLLQNQLSDLSNKLDQRTHHNNMHSSMTFANNAPLSADVSDGSLDMLGLPNTADPFGSIIGNPGNDPHAAAAMHHSAKVAPEPAAPAAAFGGARSRRLSSTTDGGSDASPKNMNMRSSTVFEQLIAEHKGEVPPTPSPWSQSHSSTAGAARPTLAVPPAAPEEEAGAEPQLSDDVVIGSLSDTPLSDARSGVPKPVELLDSPVVAAVVPTPAAAEAVAAPAAATATKQDSTEAEVPQVEEEPAVVQEVAAVEEAEPAKLAPAGSDTLVPGAVLVAEASPEASAAAASEDSSALPVIDRADPLRHVMSGSQLAAAAAADKAADQAAAAAAAAAADQAAPAAAAVEVAKAAVAAPEAAARPAASVDAARKSEDFSNIALRRLSSDSVPAAAASGGVFDRPVLRSLSRKDSAGSEQSQTSAGDETGAPALSPAHRDRNKGITLMLSGTQEEVERQLDMLLKEQEAVKPYWITGKGKTHSFKAGAPGLSAPASNAGSGAASPKLAHTDSAPADLAKQGSDRDRIAAAAAKAVAEADTPSVAAQDSTKPPTAPVSPVVPASKLPAAPQSDAAPQQQQVSAAAAAPAAAPSPAAPKSSSLPPAPRSVGAAAATPPRAMNRNSSIAARIAAINAGNTTPGGPQSPAPAGPGRASEPLKETMSAPVLRRLPSYANSNGGAAPDATPSKAALRTTASSNGLSDVRAALSAAAASPVNKAVAAADDGGDAGKAVSDQTDAAAAAAAARLSRVASMKAAFERK